MTLSQFVSSSLTKLAEQVAAVDLDAAALQM